MGALLKIFIYFFQNAYLFSGIELGTIATKTKNIANSMLIVTAKKVSDCSPSFPFLDKIRDIFSQIASATAKDTTVSDLANTIKASEIKTKIRNNMWNPVYQSYKKYDS